MQIAYVVNFKKYHKQSFILLTGVSGLCSELPSIKACHKLAQIKRNEHTLRRPKKSTFLFWRKVKHIHPYLQIMKNVTETIHVNSEWTQKRSMDMEHWSLPIT